MSTQATPPPGGHAPSSAGAPSTAGTNPRVRADVPADRPGCDRVAVRTTGRRASFKEQAGLRGVLARLDERAQTVDEPH